MTNNSVVKPQPEKAKVIVTEVVCKGSTELFGFQVEVPALKSTIEMQVTLPSIVVFNPYTGDKVTLGIKKIDEDTFTSKVKDLIATHNLRKGKAQQINISNEAIKAIYGLMTFVDFKAGDTIKVEFPIPPRWFMLKTGKYGFKWKNKLGAGLLIISDKPMFEMIEFDRQLLSLKSSQFTFVKGEFKKDVYGSPIFVIKDNGKHWLIKNIIKNSEPQLAMIANKYYRFCEEKGNRNEYAVIDEIKSAGSIKIERNPEPETLPEPPKEVIIEPVPEPQKEEIEVSEDVAAVQALEAELEAKKRAESEAAVEELMQGKKKAKAPAKTATKSKTSVKTTKK